LSGEHGFSFFVLPFARGPAMAGVSALSKRRPGEIQSHHDSNDDPIPKGSGRAHYGIFIPRCAGVRPDLHGEEIGKVVIA
jgi:hypothetical protein